MKSALYQNVCLFVIVLISLFSSVIFSRGIRDLKIKNNRCWIREDYYNKLQAGKTPFELFDLNGEAIQIYFDLNKKEALLGSLSECELYKYKIISPGNLELVSENPNTRLKTIEFIKNPDGMKIILNDFGEKSIFISLGKEYKKTDGLRNYINDKYFTGKYSCFGDKKRKIIFANDGRMSGIKNYNSYNIVLTQTPAPRGFDTVILSEIEGRVKSYEYFHWKREGDKLILYSLTNDDPPYKKIKDKYLELIKIKK